MSQSSQRKTRTVAAKVVRCFFCRREGAIPDGALLGNQGVPGEGAKIARCPEGEGCRDGQVRHGPPTGVSHWPGEPCEICPRPGKTSNDGNTAQAPRPGVARPGNRSRWHR